MEIESYLSQFKGEFNEVKHKFLTAAKTYCAALAEHGETAETAFAERFNFGKKTWELLKQVGLGIIPEELVFHVKQPFAKYAVKLSTRECENLLANGSVSVAVGLHDSRLIRLPDLTRAQCKAVFDIAGNKVRTVDEQRVYFASVEHRAVVNNHLIEGTHLDARKVKISNDGSGSVSVKGYNMSREMLVELLNASTRSMN